MNESDTPSLPALLEQAVAHHQSGRLTEARPMYEQVLSHDAKNADALHLLGLLHHQSGDSARAVEMMARAAELAPQAASIHANLGGVYRATGRHDLAVECCRRVLLLTPGDANQRRLLARSLEKLGRNEEAIAAWREAIVAQPTAEAHGRLGELLARTGAHHDAAGEYRAALALRDDDADTWTRLGVSLIEDGHPAEALDALDKAITLKGDSAAAHGNRGIALAALGRLEEAVEAYRRAIALDDHSGPLYTNVAVALARLGRHGEAVAAHGRAVELMGNSVDVHNNFGIALGEMGRYDEAMARHEHALAIDPNDPVAHFNIATLSLLRGEFDRGWREYEWRLRVPQLRSKLRQFHEPAWDGSDLGGRTILLHAEQGLGDAIQFARFVTPVRSRGAGVILLECDPALARLMAHSLEGVVVIARGEGLPPFDVQASLLSLPYLLGPAASAECCVLSAEKEGGAGPSSALSTQHPALAYLRPPPEKLDHWRQRLAAENRPGRRIGLVWSGNPAHYNDRQRSIPLERFAPLAAVEGVRLYALQKGPPAAEIFAPGQMLDVADLAPELHDFSDTAALLADLDLLISVDTSVAHLAGALARPVWTLLPFVPDWRWMLDREDSPWYPTMRLLRQPRPGDWDAVIERAVRKLRDNDE